MPFAIRYELSDAAAIAGSVNASSLPTALKNEARRYWNNGLSGWDTAPAAPFPWPGGTGPQCESGTNYSPLARVIVINYGTLAAFRQLLRDVANALGTEAARYLIALANDMEGCSGAVEPWPPA